MDKIYILILVLVGLYFYAHFLMYLWSKTFKWSLKREIEACKKRGII